MAQNTSSTVSTQEVVQNTTTGAVVGGVAGAIVGGIAGGAGGTLVEPGGGTLVGIGLGGTEGAKDGGTTQLGGKSHSGTVYSLNMGLAPFITFVRPNAAVAGTAQILGQDLTGATSVTFNGMQAASFKVATDTFMTAVVPSGATTGPVVVTTPGRHAHQQRQLQNSPIAFSTPFALSREGWVFHSHPQIHCDM